MNRLFGEPELGEDGIDVLLDRGRGEVERRFDSRVGPPPGHLAEHVQLAGGQRGQRARGVLPTSPDQGVDDCRVDDRSTRAHLAQGMDEVLEI